MSIAAIGLNPSLNPWTNPLAAAASGTAGGTSSNALAALDSANLLNGSAGTIAGSTATGAPAGLGSMMASVQSWLLQMQSEIGANAANGANSGGASGTAMLTGPDGRQRGHHQGAASPGTSEPWWQTAGTSSGVTPSATAASATAATA